MGVRVVCDDVGGGAAGRGFGRTSPAGKRSRWPRGIMLQMLVPASTALVNCRTDHPTLCILSQRSAAKVNARLPS